MKGTERRYDLCIVGGSIAGATLAAHLAAEGFSVCVLERRRPGERKLCAELTAVGLLDRLRGLTGCEGEEAISARLDRVEVRAGPFALERRFELGKGVTVDRVRLEGLLLERAASLGATVLRPLRATQVVVSDAVALVAHEGGEVAAEVIVGADGAASLVGRRLSRPWSREEVGAARHVRLRPGASPQLGGTVRFDLLPDVAGYGWLVPYGEEVGLGVGGFGGPLDGHLRRLCSRYGEVVGADLWGLARGRVRGAPVPAAGPARATFGKRFLLVGDAGGFVSPASGEGLSLAVASVEAAASALKLCFAVGRFAERSLRHYERLWRQVMPDFAVLLHLRRAMAGQRGLALLEACESDLERLLLLAPLVGEPSRGDAAHRLLERLLSAAPPGGGPAG